jgi:short-subunit dehydrogenase
MCEPFAPTCAIDLALIEADIGVSALCPGPVRTHVGEEPGRSPVASAPVHETISAIDTALKAVVENGMDPREVGDRVVEAVRAGRFWILPAPEFVVTAETRLADILAAVER